MRDAVLKVGFEVAVENEGLERETHVQEPELLIGSAREVHIRRRVDVGVGLDAGVAHEEAGVIISDVDLGVVDVGRVHRVRFEDVSQIGNRHVHACGKADGQARLDVDGTGKCGEILVIDRRADAQLVYVAPEVEEQVVGAAIDIVVGQRDVDVHAQLVHVPRGQRQVRITHGDVKMHTQEVVIDRRQIQGCNGSAG